MNSTTEELSRTDAPSKKLVIGLFSTLDKCLRGHNLYSGTGELLERMMTELDARAAEALEFGELTVRVTPFGLRYAGEPVTPEDTRVAYLFRLYCDGVRELSLLPGIERQEFTELLEILSSDPRSGEDLVTLIWKRELPHVRYYSVDTFASGEDMGLGDDLSLARGKSSDRLEQAEGLDREEIALSAEDVRVLRSEDRMAWVREAATPSRATGSVDELASRVRDSFQVDRDYDRFIAVALKLAAQDRAAASAAAEGDADAETPDASPLVLGLYDAQVYAGQSESVANMLRAVGNAQRAHPEEAEALFAAILGEERVTRLAPLYERDTEMFLPFFKSIGGHDGLVVMLTALRPGEAASALQEILQTSGRDMTRYYMQRLNDDDTDQIQAAIRALAAAGTDEGMLAIAKQLSSTLTAVRKAALQAMQGRYDPATRVALGRVLRDPEAENRLLALEILKGSGDNRVVWSIFSAIQDAGFSSKSTEEQAAFFGCLAAFKDNRTLTHLKSILAEKNLTRSKAVVQRQIMVVEALSSVGTEEAKAVLSEFRGRWYHAPEVKQAISSSLSSWRSNP